MYLCIHSFLLFLIPSNMYLPICKNLETVFFNHHAVFYESFGNYIFQSCLGDHLWITLNMVNQHGFGSGFQIKLIRFGNFFKATWTIPLKPLLGKFATLVILLTWSNVQKTDETSQPCLTAVLAPECLHKCIILTSYFLKLFVHNSYKSWSSTIAPQKNLLEPVCLGSTWNNAHGDFR